MLLSLLVQSTQFLSLPNCLPLALRLETIIPQLNACTLCPRRKRVIKPLLPVRCNCGLTKEQLMAIDNCRQDVQSLVPLLMEDTVEVQQTPHKVELPNIKDVETIENMNENTQTGKETCFNEESEVVQDFYRNSRAQTNIFFRILDTLNFYYDVAFYGLTLAGYLAKPFLYILSFFKIEILQVYYCMAFVILVPAFFSKYGKVYGEFIKETRMNHIRALAETMDE